MPLANAQEYTATEYYYNNFDGGNLGTAFTQIGAQPALAVSSSSTIGDGSYSLASTGNGKAGGYKLSFFPDNTNLTNTKFGYEWTFIYRNNDGNTDNSDKIDDGENSWKYWFFRDTDDQNGAKGKGYYLTQVGNTLYLRYRYNNNENYPEQYNTLGSYAITNGKTYAIRVQFMKKSNSFGWTLFVDEYTATQKEAKTKVISHANYHDVVNYKYSSLMVSSTTAGRFVFDEMKAYTMQLQISGANDLSYGISSPLIAGQQNAVLYGLKLETRGLFEIYQFRIDFNSSVAGNVLEIGNYGKLYKSFDAYFGNADDVQVATLNVNWGEIQNTGFSPPDVFYTTGNDDGSIKLAQYYYVTVNVKAQPTEGASFSITKAPTLQSQNSDINYAADTQVTVNTGAPSTSSGKVFDWKGGTSSDWNVASNWKPNDKGVPGANDVARIGVNETFTNQPTVGANNTVGNVQFGTANGTVPTLTISSGKTLTVKSRVENAEGITITGAGTLDVQGTYLANPTAAAKTTTASIATLNVLNFLLNTASKGATFNANGTNMLIKNALQTSGANAATFTLGSNVTLTLTGANPFSLSAATNTITFNNTGSTVVYGATVKQAVSTAFTYKNLSFSGAGTKEVASGTLNVTGNWNSAGGKVDLQTKSPSLTFNSTATQAITDTGSDSGNGVVFGNTTFSGSGQKTLSATGKFALGAGSRFTMGSGARLNTSDNLTLKADAQNNGVIDAVPSNASIQGQVTVERYVQGGSKDMWRTYRMFSSPVYDNTTDFITSGTRTYKYTQFIDDMIITGKLGTTNGFDQTSNNQAGAWTYSNNKFVAIPNINTAVNVGQGAYVFYRGNRNNFTAKVTEPFVDPESIIMTYKGQLNQQNVTVPLTTGYNLVGNPYAAAVDWKNVTQSGSIDAVVMIWNPSCRQYSTYNGDDVAGGTNGGSRYIPIGQSFFVQTASTNASVTFTESSKVGASTPLAAMSKIMAVDETNMTKSSGGKLMAAATYAATGAAEETAAVIRVNMVRDNTENADEAVIVLSSQRQSVYTNVPKLRGEAVFLSSQSENNPELTINYMPDIAQVNKIKLNADATNDGAYTLNFNLSDMPEGYQVKLKDNYLNTVTDLNTQAVNNYAFNISKANAASLGSGRFELLLSPITTLPVTITGFQGQKTNDGVLLRWKTATESNNSYFEIQRAGDEQLYSSIGTVTANQEGAYYLLDKAPLAGNNYYKLVQVDKDGKPSTYADVVVVNYALSNTVSNIAVYPTVVATSFTLKYNGSLDAGRYSIKVTDLTGKSVYSKEVDQSTVLNGYQGEISGLSPGVYFTTLVKTSNGEKLGTVKLVKK